jgi:hypothetical protein
MDRIILQLKIWALKAARRAVLSTLSEDEHTVYNAILRQKLIDNGINNVK